MITNKLIRVLQAFKCAVRGIVYAIKNERNMRFHTVAAAYVFLLSYFCRVSMSQFLILVLVVSLVMMAEMINTAIENIIDLCSKEYNTTAKIAKDIAAGGVLMISLAAAVIGIAIFFRKEAYINLWASFCAFPFVFVLIFLSIFPCYFYVFLGPAELRNKTLNLFYKIKGKIFSYFSEGDSNERRN